MYAKAITTIALAAVFLTLPIATAQIAPIIPNNVIPEISPTTPIVDLFKIPLNILFSVCFALGSVPLYIIRGFLSVWHSWGFPPIQQILTGLSFVAPAVFKDSMFILLFFCMIEFVILLLIPILGWVLIPIVWGITGVGVLLFAIADFISKINSVTTIKQGKEKTGGSAGWWV